MEPIWHYYSQYGEDYLLAKFFEFKTSGLFIDVGAFDGVHLSNSFGFELSGWNGICIEPQEKFFNFCKENRPRSWCVRAAASKEENHGSQAILNCDQTGLFSYIGEASSTKSMQEHYSSISVPENPFLEEVVPCVALSQIINQFEEFGSKIIDFVSIDVEGKEIEVLQGLNLRINQPRLLLVEAKSKEQKKTTSSFLSDYSYSLARVVGPNCFYTRTNEDSIVLRSIEITCTIEKQCHPLGIELTQQEYLDGKSLYKGTNSKRLCSEHEYLTSKCTNLTKKLSSISQELQAIKLERKNKITHYQIIVDSIKEERNEKVASLHSVIDSLRDKSLNEGTSSKPLCTEPECLSSKCKSLTEKLNSISQELKTNKLERKNKIAHYQSIVDSTKEERNEKVASLLSIIDSLREDK